MTEITAQYLDEDHLTLSRSDMPGRMIPAVVGNRHWDELVTLGITPADYVAPPEPIPSTVTPRQARLALLDAGLLDTVETELAKPENKAALISWEYATTVERDSPLIATIGGALGMTDQQIDDLFTAAAAL